MLIDPQTLAAHLACSVAQLPLLRSKLAPPLLRPDLIARPRLLTQLDRAASHKCTLVAAPAGFGKTTAISIWAAAYPAPVAWLALDATDNDPVRFWTYVITALDLVHAGVGEPALALLQSPQPPSIEEILSALLNAMSSASEPLVLILDDYHVIDVPAIHRGLGFLLDHLLPNLHLVIASRSNPPLALGRERARGGLAELRAAELRFTAAEVRALLNDVLGQQLAEPDILTLATRTEGWIAGLQLVALALPSQPDIPQFIETLRGSDRHLVDYLVEEILEQQTPEIQEFLLRTSILERFCGPLCDAVTGRDDSQAVLDQLEQHNLFIVALDRSRQWYRYHQLFAEFLRARLQYVRRDALPQLQRRAAVWHAGQAMSAEAIVHALASDDLHLAASLIDQYADTIIRHGEIMTVIAWLTALPEAAMRSYPRLYLVHAWALIMSSRYDAAEPCLNEAQRVLESLGDPEPAAAGLAGTDGSRSGEILILRAAVAAAHGDTLQARELFAGAEASLKPDNPIWQSLVWMLGFLSLVRGDVEKAHQTFIEATGAGLGSGSVATALGAIYGLGYTQMLNGNLREAGRIFEQAFQIVLKPGAPHSPLASLIYLGLSKVRREYNDLPAAQAMAVQSMHLSKRWGNAHVVVEAYLALARVQRAQGNLDAALATTQAAEAILQHGQNRRWMRSGLIAERVRIWLARDNVIAATEWARLYRLRIAKADPHMPPLLFQRDLEELMLVRVLIYQGRQQPAGGALQEAQQLLEVFLHRAEQARSQERVIEVTLLLALAWQACGEQQQMLAQLGRALNLAEPGGYIRLFIDEGAPMLQALQSYERAPQSQRGPLAVAPAYLRELIGAATGGQPAQAANGTAPRAENPAHLSEREIEVLRLIVSGATTSEIAQSLMIAPGTVKRHLHSIYGKLDVRNRVQVIDRARALSLVP